MTHDGAPNLHGEDRGLLSSVSHEDFDDGYFGVGADDDDGSSDDVPPPVPPKDDPPPAYNENPLRATNTTTTATTPRTPNRVRFDLTPEIVGASNGDAITSDQRRSMSDGYMMDLEEPASPGRSHRVPLLTDIEAPSVTMANSLGDAEERAENELRRPKSGLKSAFMNMANSIIGAGIIGQPYAIRQAGLLAGVLLLVGLTVIVDWTICLIVINSKLSGTSHFQGTVEYCFGRSGLIAISVAQWVFAFGGMVAYGVIVGDTIPHVLTAVWPGLPGVPVLGLLTNRQVAIAVFIMGIGFPLTLYRDIAKVRPYSKACATRRKKHADTQCSWQKRAPLPSLA